MRKFILIVLIFFSINGLAQYNLDVHINGMLPVADFASEGIYNNRSGLAGTGVGLGIEFLKIKKNGFGFNFGFDAYFNTTSQAGKRELDYFYKDMGFTDPEFTYIKYWHLPSHFDFSYTHYLAREADIFYNVGFVVSYVSMSDLSMKQDGFEFKSEFGSGISLGYNLGFGFVFNDRMSFEISFADMKPYNIPNNISQNGVYEEQEYTYKLDVNYISMSCGYRLLSKSKTKSNVIYY
jgi:hypothetical protein